MMFVATPATATAAVDATTSTTGSTMIATVDAMPDSSSSTLIGLDAMSFGVNEAAAQQSLSSLRWMLRWTRCGGTTTTKTTTRRTAKNYFSLLHPPSVTRFLSCIWFLLFLSSRSSSSFVVRSGHNGRRHQRQTFSRHPPFIVGPMKPRIGTATIKLSVLVLEAETTGGRGEAAAAVPVQNGDDHEDDHTVDKMVFGLEDRFDRWRFLQNLLDGDADLSMTHQILYQVLDGALKYRRPRGSFDNRGDDGGGSEGESPMVELEDEMPAIVREKMEILLSEATSGRLEVFAVENQNEDSSAGTDEESRRLTLLKRLEELLPDPSDDEDAHKSLWDTVLEIHGRESVKMEETQNPTLDWRLRNVVARLLIHHDFLTLGIVDGPLV